MSISASSAPSVPASVDNLPDTPPDDFDWDDPSIYVEDDLKPFFRQGSLSTQDPEFLPLVDKVYDLWKQNDFMPVEITPGPGQAIPPCARRECGISFDAEWPEEEDYENGEDDKQYEWDLFREQVEVARARKTCAECPLAVQCVANSVTMPVIQLSMKNYEKGERVKNVDPDLVDYSRHGIQGGYGTDSRSRIFKEILRRVQNGE